MALPVDVMLELLACSFEPWGASARYLTQPPTAESVRRVEQELGIVVPDLLVQIARESQVYGAWFASIGEDYLSGLHILGLNHAFRSDGLPPHLVMFNHGHDGDCDCWDTSRRVGDELPIVYASLDDSDGVMRQEVLAHSFHEYLEKLCRQHAPRSPVWSLRRKAKRILALHPEER